MPKVPPTAVNVVEPPLQMSAPVTLEGAVEDWFTVTSFVTPVVVGEHGPAVFSIRTQYVVVLPGDTVSVGLVAPPIGLVPTTAPVPHW